MAASLRKTVKISISPNTADKCKKKTEASAVETNITESPSEVPKDGKLLFPWERDRLPYSKPEPLPKVGIVLFSLNEENAAQLNRRRCLHYRGSGVERSDTHARPKQTP